LLFGSDYLQEFLEGEIKIYINKIKKYLTEKDYEKIMGQNAASIFGLISCL